MFRVMWRVGRIVRRTPGSCGSGCWRIFLCENFPSHPLSYHRARQRCPVSLYEVSGILGRRFSNFRSRFLYGNSPAWLLAKTLSQNSTVKPSCIQSVVTTPTTGKLIGVSVCHQCLKEKMEDRALRAWLIDQHVDPRATSEEWCDEHRERYQAYLKQRGVD